MTEPNSPEATQPPAPAATAPGAAAPPPADKPAAPPGAAGKPAHPKPGGLRAAAKGFSGERVAMPNARSRGDSKPAAPPVDLPDVNFSIRDLDKDLDAELEAAMGGLSSTELYGDLSKQQKRSAAPAGPKIGRVLSVHGADVFVDVPGGRSQGVLPLMQFPDGTPAPGTEVEVHIEGYDPANGLLRLSRQGVATHADWGTIAENQIVEARITAVNKGGLEVTVNGIRGFMPISQIDLFRVEHPEEYLNQRLT
jgi:small subunit ribosomal protein S1